MENNIITENNSLYRDDTPIGKLMHDFSCTQPEDMNYPILADRVRYFKETEEGREIMCKAIEDMVNERTLEHVQSLMKTLGLSLENVMNAMQLSKEEREFILAALK